MRPTDGCLDIGDVAAGDITELRELVECLEGVDNELDVVHCQHASDVLIHLLLQVV